MDRILKTHFNQPGEKRTRVMGRDRNYDSGYYDIIRFFGNNRYNPESISIEYLADSFTFGDQRIAEFSHLMERRFADEGRLHKGPSVMKLVDFDLQDSTGKMTVQGCRYGDQAGSCFALDLVHPLFEKYGGSLRNYYLTKYRSRKPRDNPLATCFGVCSYLLVQEENVSYLLGMKRSAHLVSLESSFGPSVAGSVDFTGDFSNLSVMLHQSLAQEAIEELALSPSEYELVPLAFAREIFRGERPQLFCLMRTGLKRSEIAGRLQKITTRSREFDTFEFMELDAKNRLSDSCLQRMNHEALMNYYLIEENLD